MELIRNAISDIDQYEKCREIIEDSVGSFEEFRQMKYNNLEKFDFIKDGLLEKDRID